MMGVIAENTKSRYWQRWKQRAFFFDHMGIRSDLIAVWADGVNM